LRIYESAK